MSKMSELDVFYHDRHVGTLAVTKDKRIAFAYSSSWIADGFSISPLSLPMEKKVFLPKMDPLDGIFGVFADSMPDGWGRLLVDRFLLKHQINPYEVGMLYRLAIVGDSGMGALSYRPAEEFQEKEFAGDLDAIANECKNILETGYAENLDELFYMGGSSGGARPKILTQIEGEDWLIKFPSSMDSDNIGKQEHDYNICARHCGIEVPEVRLFSSSQCEGYFGVKRFDRIGKGTRIERIHMVSAAGLLETTHRIPNLDYHILMKLTLALTKDFSEIERMFRLMCFNVFSHNRDDHSKNFSYIYEEENKRWKLSPAYDLTYSNSIGGEHATTVNGEGRNPSMEDILAVAKRAGMDKGRAKVIARDIQEIVATELQVS